MPAGELSRFDKKGLFVVVFRTIVYGEKEYSDQCVMCIFSKAPYVLCEEFMLEGSAEKVCFNDFGILSSENADFWWFVAKTFFY